jgi:regulator of sigma E protease
MSIIIAVIIFSVIVLFHEFGHFSMARLCGVEVLEFSLGMGPRLLSHVSRNSNTRYSVKLLPFGGSCLMKGEDGDDMTPGAFGTKKIWQRILIVAAGPVFNFILAFLFAAIIIGSAGYDAPVPEYLTEDSPLAKAGIVRGDTITSIDGRRITIYRDIANYVTFDLDARQSARTAGAWKAVQIPVEWEHDGKKMDAMVTLSSLQGSTASVLGMYGGGRFSAHGNVFVILRYSLYEVKYWIGTTLSSLAMIGRGRVSVDDVSGPVGIVGAISDTYKETRKEGMFMLFLNMLNMAILLSANLGVMNLIPFPALDGGRIVLLIVEGIRKKKLGENIEAYINLAGFAVLMGVMVFIMFNDIRKIIT